MMISFQKLPILCVKLCDFDWNCKPTKPSFWNEQLADVKEHPMEQWEKFGILDKR